MPPSNDAYTPWNLDTRTETVWGQTGVLANYTANSRNQYTTIGGDTPTWTDNGELADDDLGTTYAYDWRGQLVQVEKDRSTYTFEFDALGRRITTNFGTELRYTWAGERILEEITSSGTPTVNATWVWGNDPEPIRMKRGSDESYYHASRIGSVEKLTDDAANVVETVEYDAWGVPSISSSAEGNLFLWRGTWYDFATGLHAASRSYDAGVTLRYVVARQGRDFALLEPSRVARLGGLPNDGDMQVHGALFPPDGGPLNPCDDGWVDGPCVECECPNGWRFEPPPGVDCDFAVVVECTGGQNGPMVGRPQREGGGGGGGGGGCVSSGGNCSSDAECCSGNCLGDQGRDADEILRRGEASAGTCE